IGSATCVCISAAVAPGQIAETFTTLTVKKGSSARPSRSYEKKPAAPSATTRNRISAGWLTAQPERLKCFIAPLQRKRSSLRAKRSNPSCGKGSVDCLVASLLAMTGLKRQRRDDPDLLGRIELLHAKRDDFGAFLDAAGYDDVIALVGFDRDRLQRHIARAIDDIERGTAALAVQRRQWQPRDALGCGIGKGQRLGDRDHGFLFRKARDADRGLA